MSIVWTHGWGSQPCVDLLRKTIRAIDFILENARLPEEQLTPDDKSDDCDQVPAYDRHKSEWHKSSLSKKISKSGTPVIDELRSRGMLYDDREDNTL